jgi:hypothetical protein
MQLDSALKFTGGAGVTRSQVDALWTSLSRMIDLHDHMSIGRNLIDLSLVDLLE